MKKCYCCGADVPDQSKFCPKCGKPMAVTRDLIDRAMENDPAAQTELYERTYKTVYSRIRAKVPDEDTAMDIMQETYLHAFTGLDQLQKPETFPSWLLSIASRQVCDWFRKNGKENENVQMSQLEYENDDTISDEEDLLGQPEYREDFSPDESLDRAETGRLLSEILDSLPEDQRIILTMRYYDELSLKEISEELGLNINTVKTRLTAAKKKVEAKVLELEKSGTKLYSLGPVAFLVFLLHHAELFAPTISANTIIGLTAAGAGAGAAATAAHVTAATAAKTAVAAAAKGVSVKVIAIVAAAVVVVGGGTTATVVAVNNARAASEAAASEAFDAEAADEPQNKFVGLTPSEEAEPEPESSEESVEMDESVEPSDAESGETDTPEEPSGNESDQQEPEPGEAEANPEEADEQSEAPVELPSYDTVYEMADQLSMWVNHVSNPGTDRILLDVNQAAEITAMSAFSESMDQLGYGDPDPENYSLANYIYPENILAERMQNLFGSQFRLSDYTKTDRSPAFDNELRMSLCLEDGQFHFYILATDGGTASRITVENVSECTEGYAVCTAIVLYDLYDAEPLAPEVDVGAYTVEFGLNPDSTSVYGWAITSVQFV